MQPRRLTPDEMAQAAGLSTAALWHFATTIEQRFKPPRPSMVHGKMRDIDVPLWTSRAVLKRLQKRMHGWFRAPRVVHGGVKRRSYFTSARRHKGRRYVLQRDIRGVCYS